MNLISRQPRDFLFTFNSEKKISFATNLVKKFHVVDKLWKFKRLKRPFSFQVEFFNYRLICPTWHTYIKMSILFSHLIFFKFFIYFEQIQIVQLKKSLTKDFLKPVVTVVKVILFRRITKSNVPSCN